ncbi:hypothetical protein N657DRAFT_375299 [Parathielavia appendiculata]|uniref:Uncharacterized protein n=1 Tax=Parathielavia appendiculata TaxID=2587402 RepID=A0AAN6TQP7_9PEZI|nr:hypothetical protein N657DRAFT_375299 [Parathielavia appendiculata]
MVYYLYHFNYDGQLQYDRSLGSDTDGDGTDVDKPTRDVLVTYVYALAERYLIRGLKAVALRHFKAAATDLLDINDFLKATLEVYTSTLEDDRGLRDVVVEALYKNSQWLDKEEVRDMLKGLGALTYDLVIYMCQQRSF